ncbi:DUF3817 domain-containing protein [Myroides injenensis]|uniref:DUF3817 domain-containing protein n=1 Tax=Myroides injenensis TaxID=1183151 RepID=UPI002270B7A2|nr:DUF3817 domain-containing protein [Myroides injenensis]
MLKLFKIIAFLEGVSLLVLLFIAMPLKYILDKPEMVSKVGMAHGILFIAYIVFATVIKSDEKWSMKTYLLVCLASVVPFGTFVVEAKLLKKSVN